MAFDFERLLDNVEAADRDFALARGMSR